MIVHIFCRVWIPHAWCIFNKFELKSDYILFCMPEILYLWRRVRYFFSAFSVSSVICCWCVVHCVGVYDGLFLSVGVKGVTIVYVERHLPCVRPVRLGKLLTEIQKFNINMYVEMVTNEKMNFNVIKNVLKLLYTWNSIPPNLRYIMNTYYSFICDLKHLMLEEHSTFYILSCEKGLGLWPRPFSQLRM